MKYSIGLRCFLLLIGLQTAAMPAYAEKTGRDKPEFATLDEELRAYKRLHDIAVA
jgi:hypothetical protein